MESNKQILTAIMAAKEKFLPVLKTKNAQAGHQKYKYADLSAVLECVEEPLCEQNVLLSQIIETFKDQEFPVFTVENTNKYGQKILSVYCSIRITTKLIHSSGQELSGSCAVYADLNDPQHIGTAVSYMRRYSLLALLGLAQEDDDAKDFSKKNIFGTPQQPVAPVPNKAPTKASEAKQEFDPKEYVTKLKRDKADIEMFLSICRKNEKSWADFKTPADVDKIFIEVDKDLEELKRQGM